MTTETETPTLRHVTGGVIRGDTGMPEYDSAGEPDWKARCAELEAEREQARELASLVFRCVWCDRLFSAGNDAATSAKIHVQTCEAAPQRALMAEVTGLKWHLRSLLNVVDQLAPYSPDVAEGVIARREMAREALTPKASGTAPAAPPARNDGPGGSGEGPEPEGAPAPNTAVGCDHGRKQPWCSHCDLRFPAVTPKWPHEFDPDGGRMDNPCSRCGFGRAHPNHTAAIPHHPTPCAGCDHPEHPAEAHICVPGAPRRSP